MNNMYRNASGAFRVLAILLTAIFVVGCEKEEIKQANQEIYLYQGADRDKRLVEQAKREGVVNIFVSMQSKDAAAIIKEFEKQYGIKVELWRASPDKIAQRVSIETKAGRHDVDVLEVNGPEMERIHRDNVLSKFYSPAFADLPPAAFPKDKPYVIDRLNFFVMAYNTKLVPPGQVPNSYDDLLHPRWKNKLVIELSDVEWLASVAKSMGEEKGLAYFKKLAAQKPMMRDGHTLLAEMLASGEIAIVLTAFNHSVEKLKRKQAPVDWKPLQPAFGQGSAIGLARQAPHPHAALLFADFLLSKTGQEIIKERGRVPVSLAVDSPLNKFEYQLIDTAVVLDEWDKWQRLWADLFFDGKAIANREEKTGSGG